MPCGGIYPLEQFPDIAKFVTDDQPCWVCGLGKCKHFCEEWDATIHARCVAKFLQTEEGACVIGHGHQVFIDFGLEEQ